MTAVVMVQGCGSHVGKSVLVAGLCRHFRRRGLRVFPFKPQNMSNNAGVTADGGEIGRAQLLQARAAGVEPHSDMNPVLLKPETDTGAQIVVQGKRYASMGASEYTRHKAGLMPRVMESFRRIESQADLVLVEGAGSPAEINLRAGDIANMGFAEAADIPVVLVGDIDRGGVIASLIGSHAVLPPPDRSRIKGFLINKFRGDARLFAEAEQTIAKATGWRPLGIVPWFSEAARLPAEDILDLESKSSSASVGAYHVAVPLLHRIANFDDLDPIDQDPAFRLTLVKAGEPLPLDADLVLLPGSKATLADLAFFRSQGWDGDLLTLLRHGKSVLGLCGGYQMLGQTLADPDGIEGKPEQVDGLGLLQVNTILKPGKTLAVRQATETTTGLAVEGYEIHVGQTTGEDTARPMLTGDSGFADGAASVNGRVMGCYMHGLFASDAFRSAWLRRHGRGGSELAFDERLEETLDRLADHLATHIDLDAMAAVAGLQG